MRSLLSLVVVLPCIALSAQAQTVTGNPFADGFGYGGHSMANGNYIRGGGLFSYNLYSAGFNLTSGSNLLTPVGSSTWNVGDQIIAVGGVFNAAPSESANGWSSGTYTPANVGDTVNSNITSSLRMVSKFGSSPTSWGASTVLPGSGNGLGSDSAGHGGLGSIVIGNTAADVTSVASGTLRLGTVAQLYDGTSSVAISSSVGRMIYIYDTAGNVSSWQTFLNVTLTNALYSGTYADLPNFGDRVNVATQRGTSSSRFHDALVVVPTPGSAALLGMAGLMAARRRR